jgi:Co/Zn/Cd efflux system component
MVIEVVGGLFMGGLALLATAGHVAGSGERSDRVQVE